MQFTSCTVLFVLLFAVRLSTEQKSWHIPGGLSKEENYIVSGNSNKEGVEFEGISPGTPRTTPRMTTRTIPRTNWPPIYQPRSSPKTTCPIVECKPNVILNLTGTGLKRIGDAFIHSSDTRELYLDKNKITEFSPLAIVSLTALEVLSLSENNLTIGNILWFKEHKTLRRLVINGNKRDTGDTVIRNTFQSLPRLRELSLRRDRITGLAFSLKKFAPSLIRLDLSGNEIRSTDFLDDAPVTLTQLHLNDNLIDGLKGNVLKNLTELSISGNRLKRVCSWCDSSSSLNLQDMRRLSTLNVSRNEIDTISDDAFQYMVNLVSLDLSGNKLTSLPKNAFLGLDKLKELRLSNNILVHVPNVCPLRNLKLLDLTGNVIEAVANTSFCSAMYVETVLLAENHIQHVVDNAFHSLQALKTLDLSKNLIDKMPVTLITNSRQLQELSLKYNKITDIDELYSASAINMIMERNTLQKLHLEGNPFVSQKIGYMPYLTITLKEPAFNATPTNYSAKPDNQDDDDDSSSSYEA